MFKRVEEQGRCPRCGAPTRERTTPQGWRVTRCADVRCGYRVARKPAELEDADGVVCKDS